MGPFRLKNIFSTENIGKIGPFNWNYFQNSLIILLRHKHGLSVSFSFQRYLKLWKNETRNTLAHRDSLQLSLTLSEKLTRRPQTSRIFSVQTAITWFEAQKIALWKRINVGWKKVSTLFDKCHPISEGNTWRTLWTPISFILGLCEYQNLSNQFFIILHEFTKNVKTWKILIFPHSWSHLRHFAMQLQMSYQKHHLDTGSSRC